MSDEPISDNDIMELINRLEVLGANAPKQPFVAEEHDVDYLDGLTGSAPKLFAAIRSLTAERDAALEKLRQSEAAAAEMRKVLVEARQLETLGELIADSTLSAKEHAAAKNQCDRIMQSIHTALSSSAGCAILAEMEQLKAGIVAHDCGGKLRPYPSVLCSICPAGTGTRASNFTAAELVSMVEQLKAENAKLREAARRMAESAVEWVDEAVNQPNGGQS